ncbi:potassium voltage-gated channel subfamily C member 3-like [Dreissena polymorpha]|uniref:BTB domain-containing protein n=1 Tax=Dreissena polymorpha TaxID=45954 RepID=A0A9D4LK60_DREPO|nr:potassium voltage-gated channel subfamily C member 3-like [Dreissena polymorpha]KAH3860063.1 hypothetical protein DPMN_022956 [Dreissena polymorpha]
MSIDTRYTVFNVGGVRFQTSKETILKGKERVGQLCNEKFLDNFRDCDNTYFFDRDPNMFQSILNYIRTGELHLPSYICGPAAKLELDFWGVQEVNIQPCCWMNFNEGNSTQNALNRLEKDRKRMHLLHELDDENNTTQPDVKQKLKWSEKVEENPVMSGVSINVNQCSVKLRCFNLTSENVRRKTWRFLNRSNSSMGAKVFAYVALLFVAMSIFSFMADTMEHFQYFEQSFDHITGTINKSNTSVHGNDSTATTLVIQNTTSQPRIIQTKHPVLNIIDIICLAFFIVEYLARLYFSPNKLKYAKSLLSVIDLLAIIPDLIETLVLFLQPDLHEEFIAVGFIRYIRILRICRLIHHSTGLWILIYTLKASFSELMLLVWFMIIGVFVFSSLIYFVEDRDKFTSIPEGFWWALITMTTVGYGDFFPVTVLGKIVGSFCAMAGVLLVGFAVPSLVNNFRLYYQYVNLVIHMDKLKLMHQKAKKRSLMDEKHW